MRHAVVACILASFLAGLSIGAAPAKADWLVLKGGKKIQTDGTWVLKGDLLTVHDLNGRIISLSTTVVDTAACLRLNGNKLNIHEIKVVKPVGAAPVTPSPLQSRATPNPALPRSATMLGAAAPALPVPAVAVRAASTANRPPAGAAAARPIAAAPASAGASKPTATASPGAVAAAAVTTATTAGDDEIKARKLAAQARLRREAADRRIVDDCALLYPLDQSAFQSCVAAQRRAAAAN